MKLEAGIANLPRGSEQCWSLNREFLNKKARLSSVPPLRDSNGLWLMEPKAKAELSASTWHGKSTLPDPVEDQFSPWPEHTTCEFIAIRMRTVEHEPKNLDTSKATGPDRIGARILKELATALALPIAILARRILFEAVWPQRWKIHYLALVFKKGSVTSQEITEGLASQESCLKLSSESLVSHWWLLCNSMGSVRINGFPQIV